MGNIDRFFISVWLIIVAIGLLFFLSGCGDVNITTTSSGGNSTDPEVVQPVIVEVSR